MNGSDNSEMTTLGEAELKARVLICAYACHHHMGRTMPGGGDLMAWSLVKRLSRTHRLWVMTLDRNRKGIEAELERNPLQNVQFVYVGLPEWLRPLERCQGLFQLQAYLWQWKAYFAARKLHRQIRFDAFHHLTYENDWMASPTGALLPIPYLRGPGGGAHFVPAEFRVKFGARSRLWEYFRIGMQWVFRHDPFFALGQERARVLLMANREALEALPGRWQRKAQLMSVNGVSMAEAEALPNAPPHSPSGNSEKNHRNVILSEAKDLRSSSWSNDIRTTAEILRSAQDDRQLASSDSSRERAEGKVALPRNGKFRVLTAGRLVPIKGFDLAIRAFNEWRRVSGARCQGSAEHGSPSAELVIVGEGPERERLERLARELGLNGQVKFPGWMARESLLKEMAAADVFLFPSLRDGGGLVVVEAMAVGKPVVCLDLAGPGLHVTPECGVKVPAHSPQQAVGDLAGALERLHADPHLRLRMGQAARERAREVYDWDRIAQRISALYRDIVVSPRRH